MASLPFEQSPERLPDGIGDGGLAGRETEGRVMLVDEQLDAGRHDEAAARRAMVPVGRGGLQPLLHRAAHLASRPARRPQQLVQSLIRLYKLKGSKLGPI